MKYGYKVYWKGQEVSGGGFFPTKKGATHYAKGFSKIFDVEYEDVKIGKKMMI